MKVAIAGLGFGAEFIPICQAHPRATMHAICQRDERRLNATGGKAPNISCLLAHQSALEGGAPKRMPDFALEPLVLI